MNRSTKLLTLKLDSDQAVRQVSQRLVEDGLQVVRSFDLQTARSTHTNCTCPIHGTAICDYQMVVLLVYGKQGEPLTLVAHSQDGRTYFELVETPQQGPQRVLKTAVLQALALLGFASIQSSNSVNAN
ncbi:MAG: hypothetical protein GWN67_10835 [Phycisphaerae bacterium]|nr:hypothetical protein [Fodinibius sp.]NIU56852.1 hypothetical protein [Phycisphaerae bacterium]NIW93292.1 hypothetical protein [Phycisphaerae bacterium]NIY25889.1 hypothetical protein [Fodinibius sp.]